MDATIKKRWVELLRSEDYEQVQRDLRNDCGFCALGLLCELVDPSGWSEPVERDEFSAYYRHRGSETFPTPATIALAGLDTVAAAAVADMNDDHGKTFPEIADWIERNL